MGETEQFWGTIDFHSVFFSTMEVNGAQNSLVTIFLQNIFLCVQTFIQVELLEGE